MKIIGNHLVAMSLSVPESNFSYVYFSLRFYTFQFTILYFLVYDFIQSPKVASAITVQYLSGILNGKFTIFRNLSGTISNQTVCCKQGAGLKSAYFKFAQHLANLSTRQHWQVQKMEILLGGFQLTFCTSIITRPCFSRSQKAPGLIIVTVHFRWQKDTRPCYLFKMNDSFREFFNGVWKNYVYLVKKRPSQFRFYHLAANTVQ